MWTKVNDEAALELSLEQARGRYQRGLLWGQENLSGSTLRGKAKLYGYRYSVSRTNLLDRCVAAGVPISEERGPHNKRVLVIG